MWSFTTVPSPPVSVFPILYPSAFKSRVLPSLPATPLQQVPPFQLLLDRKTDIMPLFYARPFGQCPPSDTGQHMHFLLQPPPRYLFSSFMSQDIHLKGEFGFAFRLFPYNEDDSDNEDGGNNLYSVYQNVWLKGSQDTDTHNKETCEQTPKVTDLLFFFLDTEKAREQIISRQNRI